MGNGNTGQVFWVAVTNPRGGYFERSNEILTAEKFLSVSLSYMEENENRMKAERTTTSVSFPRLITIVR